MRRFVSLVLLLLLLDRACPGGALNLTPVIGVLTTPSDTSGCETFFNAPRTTPLPDTSSAVSCFNAYYVKWIESAGAKVAVIPFDMDQATLLPYLGTLNGVLFTGGGLNLWFNNTYVQTAKFIYDYVLDTNAKGNTFVLWGTCMGFQLLNILTANNESVLDTYAFDSEDLSLPLNLSIAPAASRLLSAMPADILEILTQQNSTMNFHHDGVRPTTFLGNANLTQFYRMLSTNVDRKGHAFVSTIESKNLPVYGNQWHPERPQFEWTPNEGISHTPDAIRAMQWMANFFINEARKSTNVFPESQYPMLIYNQRLLGEFWEQFYVIGSAGRPILLKH